MESVAEFFEKFEQRAAENNDAATAPTVGPPLPSAGPT